MGPRELDLVLNNHLVRTPFTTLVLGDPTTLRDRLRVNTLAMRLGPQPMYWDLVHPFYVWTDVIRERLEARKHNTTGKKSVNPHMTGVYNRHRRGNLDAKQADTIYAEEISESEGEGLGGVGDANDDSDDSDRDVVEITTYPEDEYDDTEEESEEFDEESLEEDDNNEVKPDIIESSHRRPRHVHWCETCIFGVEFFWSLFPQGRSTQ